MNLAAFEPQIFKIPCRSERRIKFLRSSSAAPSSARSPHPQKSCFSVLSAAGHAVETWVTLFVAADFLWIKNAWRPRFFRKSFCR